MPGTEKDTWILTGYTPLAGDAEKGRQEEKYNGIQISQLTFLDAGKTAHTLQEKRKLYPRSQGKCTYLRPFPLQCCQQELCHSV